MNIFFGILIGLFCLILLVTIHEFGHFLMARKNGVRVLEFGICFPPRAVAWVHKKSKDKNGKITYKWEKLKKEDWGKPQDDLVFSINYLPIGGFCQMDGESDADTRPHTFGSATFWQKTKILFGGVAMNWLFAIIVFTILAWTGMPVFLNNQFSIKNDESVEFTPVLVTSVVENSPAERAGFKVGDEIFTINNVDVYSAYDSAFSDFAGQTIEYKIKRREEDTEKDLTLTATLNEEGNEWGYLLGVSMKSDQVYRHYTWSAPLVGIGTTFQLTGETFSGLANMLWQVISGTFSQLSFDGSIRESGREALTAAGESVTGPVGIIGVLFPSVASSGFRHTAFMAALISVSLACMNVLPIPALDGGRFLMIFLARLKHQRLTKEREERLVTRTMIGLLIFMALVTLLDIIRFF